MFYSIILIAQEYPFYSCIKAFGHLGCCQSFAILYTLYYKFLHPSLIIALK